MPGASSQRRPGGSSSAQESPSAAPRAWLAAVGLSALLGLCRLPQPLGGDQAVFTLSARQGGALYRDFWDLKQPGIHLFYRLAHGLSPSTWLLHALELVLLLVAGVAAARLLSPSLRAPRLAPLAIIATSGFYYSIATPDLQTQIESLVWPAFLGCIAPLLRSSSPRRWLVSGLAAGCAVIFKVAYAPIVVGFLVVALQAEPPGSARRRSALSWSCGLALVPLVAVLWLAVTGGLPAFLWTTLIYPVEVVRTVSANTAALRDSLAWFGKTYAVLIVLAVLGARALRRKNDALFPFLVVWCAGAALVTSVQIFSWWRYHFLLFGPPLGLLAVAAVDEARARLRPKLARPLALAGAAAILLGGLRPALANLHALSRNDFAITTLAAQRYRESVVPEEGRLRQATVALREPTAPPGPVYAIGDPRLILYSQRRQAYPLNTYSYDVMTEGQWQYLERALREDPPALLFFDDGYRSYVRRFRPELLQLIQNRFQVWASTSNGRWLRPHPDG